jgi:hypothetical protein
MATQNAIDDAVEKIKQLKQFLQESAQRCPNHHHLCNGRWIPKNKTFCPVCERKRAEDDEAMKHITCHCGKKLYGYSVTCPKCKTKWCGHTTVPSTFPPDDR